MRPLSRVTKTRGCANSRSHPKPQATRTQARLKPLKPLNLEVTLHQTLPPVQQRTQGTVHVHHLPRLEVKHLCADAASSRVKHQPDLSSRTGADDGDTHGYIVPDLSWDPNSPNQRGKCSRSVGKVLLLN